MSVTVPVILAPADAVPADGEKPGMILRILYGRNSNGLVEEERRQPKFRGIYKNSVPVFQRTGAFG